MGDVIMFRSRASRRLGSETVKVLKQIAGKMAREAQRRVLVYAAGKTSPELLRILALYPMFRLTHANRVRSCFFCGHRIAPLELHFVSEATYICQSGTCMDS